MTVLLAGATGLVGSRVLALLLKDGVAVVSVARRPSGVADVHLTEIQVDFAALPALPAADVAICALGTTMRAAGNQAAFYAVDHDAVVAFACAAHAAGVRRFILITTINADAESRFFYPRTKGEAERDVTALEFDRLDLIHPGVIIGPRADRRPVEAVLQRVAPWLDPLLLGPLDQMRAIKAETIAAAIVALCKQDSPGQFVHANRALRTLAGARP